MPAQNLTRAEARSRSQVVSALSYEVALDLTGSAEVFGSDTLIRFDATPGSSTFVDLIAPAVQAITLNGRELAVAEVFADSRIELTDLAAHNELRVQAQCAYMNTGEGLHRFQDPVDGQVYLYSQFEVADSRRVFAVFEQPDLKATFTFTVTVPSGWVVVSGSRATTHEAASTVTYSFDPIGPISSYITAIVAGPYHCTPGSVRSVKGEIPANIYVRASLAPYLDAERLFATTQAGFTFYEQAFGVAYPFEKYDQLFVPEFNAGAMENAGAVTFLESYVFRSKPTEAMVERRALTVLHELAHMWFGDLVTMRWWDDLWLNESFAEFMATLAMAATEYPQAWTTFSLMEKSWAYRQDQLPTTHPIVADMRDLEDVEVNFDGITYAKGAAVLRQLVAWVGQDNFMAGVGNYLRKYAWGNATLADFLSELEATSGRDLDPWAAVWLERAGVTLLRPDFKVDAAGNFTSFAVVQEVPAAYPVQRPHRLVIGGYDVTAHGLERVLRLELDIEGERTEVSELAGKRRPDLILLNDEDLAYAKVRLDPQSLAVAVRHLGSFRESLPRTLLWGAAWDMVRDGQLPARKYVELVLGNIGAETDSSVLMMLLRQVFTVLDLYVAPPAQEATATLAERRLLELARASQPGSDAQLQFYKAVAARAASAEVLDEVAAILGGKQIAGLEVEPDLRWEFVTAMTAGGRWGAAEVAAELAADSTANGERAAARARAAIATAAAKEAAWNEAVVADGMANTLQQNTLAGFGRVVDRGLLEPFVDQFFAVAARVWADKTNEMAQNVILYAFPAVLASPQLLAKLDAWLADNANQPAGLVRLMTEHRDAVRRTLVAQAADV